MRQGDRDSVIPWLIIAIIIFILYQKSNGNYLCVIGSSSEKGRLGQLFDTYKDIVFSKLGPSVTKEDLHICNEIYILEMSEDPALRVKNTEYFLTLLQLYDLGEVFHGTLSGSYIEAKEVMRLNRFIVEI